MPVLIFLDAYIRCLEIEHACSNFLGTYIGSLEIKNASVKFYARAFVRFLNVFAHFQSFFVWFSSVLANEMVFIF